jgi:hypothetical protein
MMPIASVEIVQGMEVPAVTSGSPIRSLYKPAERPEISPARGPPRHPANIGPTSRTEMMAPLSIADPERVAKIPKNPPRIPRTTAFHFGL